MTLRSDLDVSIVIVGWNSAHVILPCFRSMKVGTPNVRVEIVGVDNLSAGHSAPRIREILPKPRRTAHPEHPGNAGAVYLVLDSPSARRILLLDPDTLFSGEIAVVGHVPTIALFLTHGRIIADLESGDRPAPVRGPRPARATPAQDGGVLVSESGNDLLFSISPELRARYQ